MKGKNVYVYIFHVNLRMGIQIYAFLLGARYMNIYVCIYIFLLDVEHRNIKLSAVDP